MFTKFGKILKKPKIAIFRSLKNPNTKEIFIEFDLGNKPKLIAIHKSYHFAFEKGHSN